MNRILLFLNIFFAIVNGLSLISSNNQDQGFTMLVFVLNCVAIYVLATSKK